MKGKWLSIQQYSLNNNISISTIRRHIKARKLKNKLVNGKYLIFDPGLDEDSEAPGMTFQCPVLKEVSQRDIQIASLEEENRTLKEQISELKMLLKILEQKSGIKVSV